jgi:hypothetical protein
LIFINISGSTPRYRASMARPGTSAPIKLALGVIAELDDS